MLISWKHNFIFIHIPKTAGTSLTQALAPFARPEERILYAARSTPVVRRAMTVFLGGDAFIEKVTGFSAHTQLGQIDRSLGRDTVEAMRKVCFVRNPFSRAYSLYRHICRRGDHPYHDRFTKSSFLNALDLMIDEKWASQSAFLRYVKDGRISADFVGRFERMNEDAAALFQFLDLPPRKRFPKVNVGAGPMPDYSDLYKNKADSFVQFYRDDFENFGYSVDPAKAGEPPAAVVDAQPSNLTHA